MNNALPKITLISVSKPKQPWGDLCANYIKRLERVTSFSNIVVKEKGSGEKDTRTQTSKAIIEKIPDGSYVIILDETGIGKKSVAFAEELAKASKPLCFIIGSSYGVSQELLNTADIIMRLSDMVLPHEFARVLLLEQLYRAHAILTNHPYHHP